MKKYFNKQFIRNFTISTKEKIIIDDSILKPLNNLNKSLEHRDAIFVSEQKTRWTVNELNFYSDSFAYYLAENGLSNSKILFWTGVNHTLENITAAIGALKVGSTIVASEYENWIDIEKTLSLSKADLLVISPFNNYEKNTTYLDNIMKSIPEMRLAQYGDIFKSQKFPNLKQIIQISHKTIPGAEKFKHCMNYTRSSMTNISLPSLNSESNVFEIHTNGDTVKYTHEECLEKIEKFSKSFNLDYSNVVNSAPIFYPVNISLGLLGSLNNRCYSIFTGNFNFIDSLKMIDSNKAEMFICEENMLNIKPANDKIKEIKEITSNVKHVVVFTNANSQNKGDNFKELFSNAEFHYYDELKFNKL